MDSYDDPNTRVSPGSAEPGSRRTIFARALYFLVVAVCWVYFIGLGVTGTYFNWRYARDHGFVSWIFSGEVVATAKAFAWPYWTRQLSSTIRPYVSSQTMRGAVHTISQEDQQLVMGLLKKSIEESRQIPDSLLAKLHEDLPSRMESQRRKGTQLLIASIQLGIRDLWDEGAQLMNEFGE